MKNTLLASVVLSVSIMSSSVFALDMANYNQAVQLQQKTVAGDSSVTEETFELFEKLVKDYPENPIVLAYLGSTETLLGRDAWMPWSKMAYVDAGLEKIDKAIEMIEDESYQDKKIAGEWQSMLTRNIAANTFVSLPSMFNRFQSAQEELQLLLESDKLSQVGKNLHNSIYSIAIKIATEEEKLELVETYQKLLK